MFRILSFNASGAFSFLSFFPMMLSLSIWCYLMFFVFGFWSHLSLVFIFIIMIVIIPIVVFWFECINDYSSCLYDFNNLLSITYYVFIWFILSEAVLFGTFFFSMFSEVSFSNIAFSQIPYSGPLLYWVSILSYNNYVCFFFYIDIISVIDNSLILFISGLMSNIFIIMISSYITNISHLSLTTTVILGISFLGNQFWEFSLLSITISGSASASFIYIIDGLHFSHVLIGTLLLWFLLLNLYNYSLWNVRIPYIYCIILYWHFVDVIWFILLSLLYIDILIA